MVVVVVVVVVVVRGARGASGCGIVVVPLWWGAGREHLRAPVKECVKKPFISIYRQNSDFIINQV